MNCKRVREILTAEAAPAGPGVPRHLEGCEECRRFARRMEAVRLELRRPQAALEPDASFSARVLGRLPGQPAPPATELLGWAALRLLPLTLMLALLLGGWSLFSGPAPEALLTSVDQDPIAWILGEETGGS